MLNKTKKKFKRIYNYIKVTLDFIGRYVFIKYLKNTITKITYMKC